MIRIWLEANHLTSDDLAKIVMLRLNIGSGMLRLSSCMPSIGHSAFGMERRKCDHGLLAVAPPHASGVRIT